MADIQFQIKRGLSSNIATATPVQGCWYLTTDTNELYTCDDGKTISPIVQGGIRYYTSTSHLPSVGMEDIVYFIVDTSGVSLYRWTNNPAQYNKLEDKSLNIKIIDGGTSIDSDDLT